MKLQNLSILLLLLFSACITQKRRAKICATCPTSIIIKDSINTVIVKKDTTIYITQLGETVFLKSPCDSLGKLKPFAPIIKYNKGLVTTLKNVNGTLVAECDADSLKRVIVGLNKIINETKITTITKTIELPCDKPHRNWLDKFCRWFTLFTLLIIIGYFSPKIIKLFV